MFLSVSIGKIYAQCIWSNIPEGFWIQWQACSLWPRALQSHGTLRQLWGIFLSMLSSRHSLANTFAIWFISNCEEPFLTLNWSSDPLCDCRALLVFVCKYSSVVYSVILPMVTLLAHPSLYPVVLCYYVILPLHSADRDHQVVPQMCSISVLLLNPALLIWAHLVGTTSSRTAAWTHQLSSSSASLSYISVSALTWVRITSKF